MSLRDEPSGGDSMSDRITAKSPCLQGDCYRLWEGGRAGGSRKLPPPEHQPHRQTLVCYIQLWSLSKASRRRLEGKLQSSWVKLSS